MTIADQVQVVLAISTIVLAVATVVTVVFLRKYVDETQQLRVAARDQVEATSRIFTQTQRASIMPVLTVDFCEKLVPGVTLRGESKGMWSRRFLALRNVGVGPAFNIRIEVAEKVGMALCSSSSMVGAGEESEVSGIKLNSLESGALKEREHMFVEMPEAWDFLPLRIPVSIFYESLARQKYRSDQEFVQSADNDGLTVNVEFISHTIIDA